MLGSHMRSAVVLHFQRALHAGGDLLHLLKSFNPRIDTLRDRGAIQRVLENSDEAFGVHGPKNIATRRGGQVRERRFCADSPCGSQSAETIVNRMVHGRDLSYNSKVEGNIVLTTLDASINWMRKNSLWPMPMGLACCAIELMAASCARFDIARFGAEVMRFSPAPERPAHRRRHGDL